MSNVTETAIQVGLRIDVDTLNGTREGVPFLLELLQKHGISASIFFSVGPDNMGRHLRRLLKPAFLLKMIRSNAPGLYGWSILFQGTFWPGRKIGKAAADVMLDAATAGHEIGLHAWDHHYWQIRIDSLPRERIAEQLELGMTELKRILARPVSCSASAGWKCNDRVLLEKQAFDFSYNSDCRGDAIFIPVVQQQEIDTPQIPVTLPTYDEIIGSDGINDRNYNEQLLSLIKPGQLNVLTIHAEVEGVSRRNLAEQFFELARQRNICFYPLGHFLPEDPALLPRCTIESKPLPGREGTVCWQGSQVTSHSALT
jgi:undecaprenyl phosphate-alpha-L-ara4FN deformylase